MKHDEILRETLLPLLDEYNVDRWSAIENTIRQKQLPVVKKSSINYKKMVGKLIACAAAIAVSIGGLLQSSSSTDKLVVESPGVSVEESVGQSDHEEDNEDEVYINEMNAIPGRSNILISPDDMYKKELNMSESIDYLGYDILPDFTPSDIQFRKDLFDKKPPALSYYNNGTLIIHPMYNTFNFVYSNKTDTARQIQICCSKTTIPNGGKIYTLKNPDEKPKVSIINNMNVKVGHSWFSQNFEGSTELTHTDRYVAEFTIKGIHTQVVTDNLSLEEFLTVVKSMIR